MQKSKLKCIALVAILLILFSSTFVLATEENEANSDMMPISSDTIDSDEDLPQNTTAQEDFKKGDEYLFGDSIVLDKIVDGNVFIVGNDVTINTQVGGDVFVLANKLTIAKDAAIYSNLFAAASTINIEGLVYDVYATAKDMTLTNGYIYRDLKVAAQNLNIFGTIGRNAFVTSTNIKFSEDGMEKAGIINGDLHYQSDSELTFPEGSVIGNIAYEKIIRPQIDFSDHLYSLGSSLVLLLVLWLLGLWLAPKFIKNTNELLKEHPTPVIVSGLLGIIAIPLAAIILLFLGITASTSLLLLTTYFILLAISKSIFVISLNNWICSRLKIEKTIGIFGILILTGIVAWLVPFIPYLGSILGFIMVAVGLGIILGYLITQNANKKEKNIVTESVKEETKQVEAKQDKKEDKE